MTGSTTRAGSNFGHYRIRTLLGSGGMGEVYEAYDTDKDRVVALKILSDQHSGEETFRERFRRESHAAAKLQEPHVIPIHDWGDLDGTLYIDMRCVNGLDLRALLKDGPLSPEHAVAIISQIAAALDAAHAAGLIHRDVKPENILVTPADFAYLVDFGIAEAVGETRLTSVGTAVGSFAYMAPERFDDLAITPAADVYSLACVLHETLAGSAPYPSTSLQQVIAAHASAAPPRPSVVNPAVPASFDRVIARGMAKQPGDRYVTAGALARAAQQALHAAGQTPDRNATLAAGSAPTANAPHSYPTPSVRPADVPQQQTTPRPARPAWVIPAIVAAAVAAAVTAAGVTMLVGSGSHRAIESSAEENGPTSTAAAEPTLSDPSRPTARLPEPAISAPQVALPPNARICPTLLASAGTYTKSAAGTTVTSCEFSEAVRVAYGRSGPPSPAARVITAYSPITRKTYPMTCAANDRILTCTGGDDALVYAY